MTNPVRDAYLRRLADSIQDTHDDNPQVAHLACLAVSTATSQEREEAMRLLYDDTQEDANA